MQVKTMRQGTWLQFAIGGLLAYGMMAGLSFAQQQIISAQSGTVQYVEGSVYANDQRVERKFGQFPALRRGEELRTEDGRAEVLLTPGAFLRISDHSSVRMLSNSLSDTRVEVLTGSVLVECAELLKDNAVSLVYQGETVQLEKRGLYRLDTAPAELRVYDGEAVVQSTAGETRLKPGKKASLDGVLAAQHFDRKLNMDDFYQWSSQRSSNLAYATISTSQSVLNTGTTWRTGGWMWSSLLDEYTYLPGAGLLYSPFGWSFWSPVYMGYYYTPVFYGASPATATAFGNGQGGTKPASGGAATNPRGGTTRPVPVFPARSSSVPGASYGGVAAMGVGLRSSSSGGFAGFPAAGGTVNGGGFNNAPSVGGSSNAGGNGGFHGGGFSGGGGRSGSAGNGGRR